METTGVRAKCLELCPHKGPRSLLRRWACRHRLRWMVKVGSPQAVSTVAGCREVEPDLQVTVG